MRKRSFYFPLLAGALAVTLASVAGAQMPNASPAATGLSGAYTARARGYDAVAWNPANLGLPGNPGFSLGLIGLSGASGLDPISLSDVAPYSKKDLPATVREGWLTRVTTNGGESGNIDGGLTEIALSIKHLALQVGTSVGVSSTISPDAFQALMFGNAGRTGLAQDLSFKGSNISVGAFSTGALSYGFQIAGDDHSDSHLSIGATVKYVMGNVVAKAQDLGSVAGTSAVTLNFPVVYSRPDSSTSGVNVGNGTGLDLGMAWTSRKLTISGAVQNVMNTFKWDQTKLFYKPGTANFDGTTNTTNFDDAPFTNAPQALKDAVANDKFKPVVAGGIAYALNSITTLSGDVHEQIGDGILLGPKSQIAGGVEFRGIPFLALRGGVAAVTGGWGFSGGVGLHLAGYELGVGAGLRTISGGKEPLFTVNLLNFR